MPLARLMEYCGGAELGFQLPLNFELARGPRSKNDIQAAIEQYVNLLPKSANVNWVLGNHDLSRVATRLVEAHSRIAAMMTFTLEGAPFIYNGDELGMTDVEIPGRERKDTLRQRGGKARDPQRSPMSWDENGGFTTGVPWLSGGAPHSVH
jgi:alpha-glucosidase